MAGVKQVEKLKKKLTVLKILNFVGWKKKIKNLKKKKKNLKKKKKNGHNHGKKKKEKKNGKRKLEKKFMRII